MRRGWFWKEHSGEAQDSAASIILIALQRTKGGGTKSHHWIYLLEQKVD